MDLRTKYLGLRLNHPFVASASPLSKTLDGIKRLEDGGASASRLIHLYPLSLFGVIPWPAIAPLANLPTDQMKAAHDAFELGHEVLGKLAYLLILLHVGAALRHQFFKRDDIVARMVPLLRMRHSA